MQNNDFKLVALPTMEIIYMRTSNNWRILLEFWVTLTPFLSWWQSIFFKRTYRLHYLWTHFYKNCFSGFRYVFLFCIKIKGTHAHFQSNTWQEHVAGDSQYTRYFNSFLNCGFKKTLKIITTHLHLFIKYNTALYVVLQVFDMVEHCGRNSVSFLTWPSPTPVKD